MSPLSQAVIGTASRKRWGPLLLGSDLTAWFDASVTTSVTTATGGVSQWDDLSGNGNHATQGTSGNRPDSVTNAIDFVAANGDKLATTMSASSLSRCAALVIKPDVTSGYSSVVGSTTVGTGCWLFGFFNGKLNVQSGYIADLGNMANSTIGTSSRSVVLCNTTDTTWRLSLNGTAESGTHSRTLTSGRSLGFGIANGSSNPYDGTMCEAIIAPSLSTADQQRLEGYLAHKWGLLGSLPSDHPYKVFHP